MLFLRLADQLNWLAATCGLGHALLKGSSVAAHYRLSFNQKRTGFEPDMQALECPGSHVGRWPVNALCESFGHASPDLQRIAGI